MDKKVREIELALLSARNNLNESIEQFGEGTTSRRVLNDINKILSFAEGLLSLLSKKDGDINAKYLQGRADQLVRDAGTIQEYKEKIVELNNKIEELEMILNAVGESNG